MILDAHVHLWKKQSGQVNGKPVFSIGNGKSNFGGEVRQMMPPYMTDGKNTAERLLANMDYAGVSGAVITQEQIDGNQDEYLLSCKRAFPRRFKICSLYEENKPFRTAGFDGIKLCAARFSSKDMTLHEPVFRQAAKEGKFISVDLMDGDRQTASLQEMIAQFPDLRIAIGHFGMVTRPGWTEQIKLARYPNVFIESGGITWLFHREFYPYPSAVRAIREAAELCGMEKLMWGSDYPRTMVEITYKMSFDFLLKTTELSEKEKQEFLFENARAFYRFDAVQPCAPIGHMLD